MSTTEAFKTYVILRRAGWDSPEALGQAAAKSGARLPAGITTASPMPPSGHPHAVNAFEARPWVGWGSDMNIILNLSCQGFYSREPRRRLRSLD